MKTTKQLFNEGLVMKSILILTLALLPSVSFAGNAVCQLRSGEGGAVDTNVEGTLCDRSIKSMPKDGALNGEFLFQNSAAVQNGSTSPRANFSIVTRAGLNLVASQLLKVSGANLQADAAYSCKLKSNAILKKASATESCGKIGDASRAGGGSRFENVPGVSN